MQIPNLQIKPLALVILTLALVAALACLPGPSSEATGNGADLTPDEVLARTQAAMDAVGSYRFETTSLYMDGSEWEGSGEWVAPDRYHANHLGAEEIVIGRMSFYRPTDGQEWTRVGAPDSQPPPYGEHLHIPDMTEVQMLPSVENGAYQLEGMMAHMNAESPHPLRTRVTLTVDDQNFRIRELTRWLLPEQRAPRSFCSLDPEAWGYERAQDCPHQSVIYFDYGGEIEIRPPE